MPKKLTQEEYERKVKLINPNIAVIGTYINNETKILHKCLREGCGYEWETKPRNILYRNTDCPKCSYKINAKKRTFTQKEYIDKVKSINSGIKVIGKYVNNHTPIEHMCKKCGYGSNGDWVTMPSHILDSHGCPVCSGNIIGSAPEYKNSIFAQEKYKKFFQNYMSEEQMKSNMPNSHTKILVQCPDCGKSKYISPNTLLRQGLGCVCSDGVSYPNKFMFAFLDQTGFYFDREHSFEWSNKKIYDFYIPDLKCIIECHGEQHYRGWGHDVDSLKEIQLNDINKKKLAIDNGINDKNYIVIDCRKSNASFISNNIVSSGLLDILDCNILDIDLDKCDEFATSSMVKLSCDMWNNGHSVSYIKEAIKTSGAAVSRYLKAGKKLGWCNNYTSEESNKRSSNRGVPNLKNATPIYCMELDRVFESQRAASKHIEISDITIGACCRGTLNTANNMHWYYLYDRNMRDGVVIKGAITLGLITEERALYQLSNVKNIKQTLQFAC